MSIEEFKNYLERHSELDFWAPEERGEVHRFAYRLVRRGVRRDGDTLRLTRDTATWIKGDQVVSSIPVTVDGTPWKPSFRDVLQDFKARSTIVNEHLQLINESSEEVVYRLRPIKKTPRSRLQVHPYSLWPSSSGWAIAVLRLTPDELAACYGFTLEEGVDGLDNYRRVAIALPDGSQAWLMRHIGNPFPGTAVYVDSGVNFDQARALVLEVLGLTPDAYNWVSPESVALPRFGPIDVA